MHSVSSSSFSEAGRPWESDSHGVYPPELLPVPDPTLRIDPDLLKAAPASGNPSLFSLHVSDRHVSRIIPHVPNTTFVHWLEFVATIHAAQLGYDEAWHRAHNLIWFVRRHEIDYRAEVRLGNDLIFATWCESFHKASCHRAYAIYRPKDDTVVCSARTVWVLVQRSDSRPRRIDQSIIDRFMA